MVYFVTAIGTDSGKTLVSAILTQALQADYWKPVQAGLPADIDTVYKLVKNPVTRFHPEAYRLLHPMSPHAAAQQENKHIRLDQIELPSFEKDLVIEGAGGLLVPLNKEEFVIDMAHRFKATVILVANLYLGSINHTLLTVNELKRRNLPVKGIVFNWAGNADSEDIILKHSGYRCLLRIPEEHSVNEALVDKYAKQLKYNLLKEIL
jgi:dethiobiotin synthetase